MTGLIRRRLDVPLIALMLGAAILAPLFIPNTPVMSGGRYGVGLVSGCILALQAAGVVLVYRSNRIINFAQVQMGTVAAVVFYTLTHQRAFLRLAQLVCPTCGGGSVERSQGWPVEVNFWLSVLVGLLVGAGVGYLCNFLVIKRFRDAPRLVVTVLTVALAELLAVVTVGLFRNLPVLFGGEPTSGATAIVQIPYKLNVTWSPVTFHSAEIATVAVSALAFVGLALFFRLSKGGVVIRASTQNPERAETLGLKVDSIGGVVWVAAGLLSGLAAMLQSASFATEVSRLNTGEMLRILAVAVIAGLASLPLAVIGAIALGIAQVAILWSFKASVIFEAGLFPVILLFLLIQRPQAGRADVEASAVWRASREVRPIPKQLREVPVVAQWIRWLRIAGIVVALGSPFVLTPAETNYGSVVMIFAMVGLSLLVLTGWAGQISLGQFAFAGIGAFASALLSSSVPFPISVVLGALAGGLVAVVAGIPAIRLRGLHLAIATLALAAATTDILLNPSYLGGNLPGSLDRPFFFGLDMNDERVYYYFTLVLLGLVILAVLGMRRSRIGRVLVACRDNERAAQSFGINLIRARLTAFAISGTIAAAAGGIYVFHQRGLNATSYLPSKSVGVFLMSVVGGFGSVAGPPLGALYIQGLQSLSPDLAVLLGTGLGLIVLFLFAPGGLLQVIYSIRDVALRRVAVRYRVVVPSLLADRHFGADGDPRTALAPDRARGGGARFTPVRYRLANQAVGADERGAESKRYTFFDQIGHEPAVESEPPAGTPAPAGQG